MSQQPFVISVNPASSVVNRTGAWRTMRPEYVSLLPPCNHACPAGENIQAWLGLAMESREREAWEQLVQDNPFPAIHGRVCYHPCEDACNRTKLDEPVAIHAVERHLGDRALREGWKIRASAPTNKRVLVVGAGPSGLACAYHLARRGHVVEIYESAEKAGGMMRYGIPAYRLPRDVLDGEIQRVLDLGVTLHLRAPVADLMTLLQQGSFDAAFLAIGAQTAKRVDIPTRDAGRIVDAVKLLHDLGEGRTPDVKLGRRVAVYGGGNTALDAARTAMRLGAAETVIVYRRDQAHMPAHESELREALDEGVIVHWLRTVQSVEAGRIQVEVMELDEKGTPRPTGRIETIEADTLILALGQTCQSEFLRNVPGLVFGGDGVLNVDANMMTGYPGLFAGGDMVPAQRSVTTGVGHGKKAARNIDAYLRGAQYTPAPKPPLATFERLNTWYYERLMRARQPELDLRKRQAGFDEIHGSLAPDSARAEAQRCLSCGNCFACDNCYAVCPDNAVLKLGPGRGYAFNLDYCKGCSLCVKECPCGAIASIAETG